MAPSGILSRKLWLPASIALILIVSGYWLRVQAADHKDSPDAIEGNLDITDLYVFSRGDSLVFVMNVSPLLTAGAATSAASFNPEGLYQFKLDKERDGVEEVVIQATFAGTGATQDVFVRGPEAPRVRGTAGNTVVSAKAVTGKIGQNLEASGIRVFAGPRDDPFFLNLTGDSSLTSVLNGAFSAALGTTIGATNEQALAFANPGADDFQATNTLSIVVQVPKSVLAAKLGADTDSTFYVWATTSRRD